MQSWFMAFHFARCCGDEGACIACKQGNAATAGTKPLGAGRLCPSDASGLIVLNVGDISANGCATARSGLPLIAIPGIKLEPGRL